MTIVPLPKAYNGQTHVRLVNINLDSNPSIAHFHLGHFEGAASPMPYSGEELPEGWSELQEFNTAPIPVGITSLAEVVGAIAAELQAHA